MNMGCTTLYIHGLTAPSISPTAESSTKTAAQLTGVPEVCGRHSRIIRSPKFRIPDACSWGSDCVAIVRQQMPVAFLKTPSVCRANLWPLMINHYHHMAASNYAKKLLLFRLLYVNVKTHTYKHCLPLSKRRLSTQIPFMHASAAFFECHRVECPRTNIRPSAGPCNNFQVCQRLL